MASYINVGGSWKTITNYFVNVGGTFKELIGGWINVSGVWKSFFASTLAPQSTVIISQATNATTGLTTLTGTNYYWSPGPPSLTYRFQWWNGTSWSDISTDTAVNPSFGSSTSYTQILLSTGPSIYVQPNQVNRFRFKVDATYGTQSTSSISSETTIQGPTNVTLTAGTAAVTSVQLSWSASTGANRYMIYYSTDNSTFSLYAGTNSLSATVSGLTSNTLYYFKVIPITGTTNDTGYYGSYSNTVSKTTLTDLANTAVPTISGTVKEGQTITGSDGTWNVTPDSYTYQWLYFDQIGVGFEGYLPISSATSASYAIPSNYRSLYGTSIRFKVTAVKSGYTSKIAYSSASTVAALATIPDAPTSASGTNVGTNRAYGNGAVDLSWTAPTNTGGVSLTGYKIQYQVPGVGTTWYDWSANATDTSSTSITLTGLGAVGYNFRIYAVNSVGSSTSASSTGTISITTVPQAPTIGTATTFNGYVSVTYTGGATGGSAITSYTATSTPGSVTGSASSGAITVTGLTHNTAYTFKVTATNANGTSLASAASGTAYGVNVGAPTITSSSVSSNQITLGFTAGANSTGTRAYVNGNLDGSTTGASYLFILPAYNTSYTLGLAGTATVNSVLYQSTTTSGSYTTGAAPFVTPAPTTPPSFVFSRNLNGGTSSTRRNWFWNVSSGIGSYSYVIYELHWYNQTTEPASGATATTILTFGSSTTSAPVSNANTYNYSGTSTPSYRTMARGSSYAGTNNNTIAASSAVSYGKVRCRVTGTNGTTYNSSYTGYL